MDGGRKEIWVCFCLDVAGEVWSHEAVMEDSPAL